LGRSRARIRSQFEIKLKREIGFLLEELAILEEELGEP